eukprot:TRINITY_DN39358_c0_g3_i1.p2 TRINITY_DN39358_c0_g3~~TRINITY_DN39358_c0_g3_i1.p2  ORF type:complete len:246 (-),score=61.11 TRINITY_DN39358_c0_g3_i1:122-859(-)
MAANMAQGGSSETAPNANELINFMSENVVVKNTFLEVVTDDRDEDRGSARQRSHSFDSSSQCSSRHARESYSLAPLGEADLSPRRRPSGTLPAGGGAPPSVGSNRSEERRLRSNGDASQPLPQQMPDPPPGMADWSKGSELHAEGGCRPCIFYRTPQGCTTGVSCSFCHFEHDLSSRKRPCKMKRQQCKQIARRVEVDSNVDIERLAQEKVGQRSSAQKQYLESLLKRKMESHHLGPPSTTRLSL